MECKICERKANRNGYCKAHLKAYENIVEKYNSWKKALKITWKEYLSEIDKNQLTGEWAKEVAKYLARSGEIGNVPEG